MDSLSSDDIAKFDLQVTSEQKNEIIKDSRNEYLESLFIFATDKSVISNLLNFFNVNKTTGDWKHLTGLKKNDNLPDDLLIMDYQYEKPEKQPLPGRECRTKNQ